MPKYYWFHCSNCGFETYRYRNTRRCPQCQGDLTREPSMSFQAACWTCGTRSDLEMFAHRNDDGFIVGWLFVCAQCVSQTADRDVVIEIVKQVQVEGEQKD